MFPPALPVKAAMDDLAGTSLAHQLELIGLACKYRTECMDELRAMMVTLHELILDEFDRIPNCSEYGFGTLTHRTTLPRGVLVPSARAAACFLPAARGLTSPIEFARTPAADSDWKPPS